MIDYPKNYNNWPAMWKSIFDDGVEACKSALPSQPDNSLIKFLQGEHPINGYWFGDEHPDGYFWWRKFLSESLQPDIDQLKEEIDSSNDAIKALNEHKGRLQSELTRKNEQIKRLKEYLSDYMGKTAFNEMLAEIGED